MELKEVIQDAFKYIGKEEVHVSELAQYVKDFASEYKDKDSERLRNRVNAVLANDLKKIVKGKKVDNPESVFVKIKNGKKGYKKGIYALRKVKVLKPIITADKNTKPQPSLFDDKEKMAHQVFSSNNISPISSDASKTHIGKGGEFAVVSELLFRAYNANIMSVDDGIDISASKNDKFYFIQVKTTEFKDQNSPISINLDKSSFLKYNASNIYYIIVIRYLNNGLPLNQFLIFNSRDIEKFTMNGLASENTNYYTLKFRQFNGDIFIQKGNKNESIKNVHLNNWDWIK